MDKLKSKLCYYCGRVYVPKHLAQKREDLILHISDTPAQIFPSVIKFIKKLQPRYIIHTGDLVDNIKLGSNPKLINTYTSYVGEFIKALEDSYADNIYLAMGNNDNEYVVRTFTNRSIVIPKSDTLFIRDADINVGHYAEDVLQNPATFNLFGHDLSTLTKKGDEVTLLNGVMGINIISLKTREVFILRYPWGTDDMRFGKKGAKKFNNQDSSKQK